MKSTDSICSIASMRVVGSITLLIFVSIVNNLKALSGDYELIRLTFFPGFYPTLCQTSDSLLLSNTSEKEEVIQNTEQNFYNRIYFVGIPDDLVLNCGDPLPDWPVVVATDNITEFEVIPRERVEFSPCGGKIINRNWSVTDPGGKQISREQNIAFTDNTAPFIEIRKDTIVASGSEIPLPYYEAGDYGCSTFVVDITQDEYILDDKMTSILRTYVVTDGCGNRTTKIQQIQIREEETETPRKSKSVSVLEYRKIKIE